MGFFDKFKSSKNKTPITSEERKKQSEKILKQHNIPFIEHLPFIEDESEARLRDAKEIAKRVLILTYLCYVGEVPSANIETIEFLKKENLWNDVSPEEQLLFQQALTDRNKADISWSSEAIWLLLWSINKVDKLELPYQQVTVMDIIQKLPKPFTSTKAFIESATVRHISEILDVSDLTYRLHWATRQSTLTNSKAANLNPSIVYERHYAINWVTYYADDWDDITTDT